MPCCFARYKETLSQYMSCCFARYKKNWLSTFHVSCTIQWPSTCHVVLHDTNTGPLHVMLFYTIQRNTVPVHVMLFCTIQKKPWPSTCHVFCTIQINTVPVRVMLFCTIKKHWPSTCHVFARYKYWPRTCHVALHDTNTDPLHVICFARYKETLSQNMSCFFAR